MEGTRRAFLRSAARPACSSTHGPCRRASTPPMRPRIGGVIWRAASTSLVAMTPSPGFPLPPESRPMRFAVLSTVLAVLFTSRSAQAACECYQSDGTGTTPGGGYLALVSVPCTSTPPGYAWIKPRNLSQNESPNLHIAVPASWTWNGCTYVDFMFRDANGVPRIVMFYSGIEGCSTQPPNVQPDVTPPDSERQSTYCPSPSTYVANAYGVEPSCIGAEYEARAKVNAQASSTCPGPGPTFGPCIGSWTVSACQRVGFSFRRVDVQLSYSCKAFQSYNLCQ